MTTVPSAVMKSEALEPVSCFSHSLGALATRSSSKRRCVNSLRLPAASTCAMSTQLTPSPP